MHPLRDDEGAATLVAVGVISALVAVLLLVGHVGVAVLARHRAQSAADLSALAAAVEQVGGQGDPCAVASVIVDEQRISARVARCVVDGDDVVVEVVVPVGLGRWGVRDAGARARAGPVG
ncbi:MAG: flp pilus-assembly TadE/G-like family protein [Gordonia sp. (in: high G+C Gram-positive bacteria)]